MESAFALKYQQLIKLSEQQLVDCSTPYGNKGCQGGSSGAAYQYATRNMMETEQQYPYTATDGNCHAYGGVARLSN